MNSDKENEKIPPITEEEYKGLFRLTYALLLHKEGHKIIPLTKKGKILEDYDIYHSPMTAEFASWFGFLKYDVGIVNTKTITHVKTIYAKPSGEFQNLSTDRLISDMLCESVYSDTEGE